MFTSVTWFQFLLYAAFALALYYTGVLVYLYRAKLVRRMSGAQRNDHIQPASPLMGPVAEEDMAVTSTADLQVAPPRAEANTGIAPSCLGVPGELGPFLAEAELLLADATVLGDKEELLSLLRLLAGRYSTLSPDHYRQAASHLLLARCADTLPYPVRLEDLLSLWESAAPHPENNLS
ncbi:hypothetical protein H7F15_12225 [Pontibacter sp. Tf4]|uniref:hypothetical protein n=1 Tax=Pontibacter sp. Tf4 TaxID=2761620 RepID=UPI001626F17D|nr:hypothetical protein [Pontibacter sp. Tf4]MBB6611808.1 hypothetical protein [Pontibacter sp. Tf4]